MCIRDRSLHTGLLVLDLYARAGPWSNAEAVDQAAHLEQLADAIEHKWAGLQPQQHRPLLLLHPNPD